MLLDFMLKSFATAYENNLYIDSCGSRSCQRLHSSNTKRERETLVDSAQVLRSFLVYHSQLLYQTSTAIGSIPVGPLDVPLTTYPLPAPVFVHPVSQGGSCHWLVVEEFPSGR